MSTTNGGKPFLDEFKKFITFLQNLWGILAGVSVLFPLSNTLVKVIPLETIDQDGVFTKLTPPVITTIATLATVFLILWTFSNRGTFRAPRERPRIRRQALITFGGGILALVLYLVGYYVTLASAYPVWGWESESPRHLLAEVPLMASYAASFALVTRAFVLLGMLEFFSAEGVRREG